MKERLIYIIVPAYNSERFLDECARSIEVQTYQNWRGVIVDDGSTDGTHEVAKACARRDERWGVIHQENGGAPSAVNAALKCMISGTWAVAFCDHDDLWLPEKLAKQVACAAHRCSNEKVWSIGTLMEEFDSFLPGSNPRHSARPGKHKVFSRTTGLLSRQLVEKLGPMDLEIRFGDFFHWLSPAINDGLQTAFVEEVLTRRRVHENNMTVQPDREQYLQMIRAHMMGRNKSNF